MLSNFFSNWGQSTPWGRGQFYKIWGQLALFEFFAIANERSRKNDFCEQLKQPQLFLQFVGLPIRVSEEEEEKEVEEECCLWPVACDLFLYVCRVIAMAK
jgi:hypothetical protein